ncbi:MAG: hypothetical protein HN396_10800 [Gemmatimonadales bacterium]|mgnify:FL=1|jgi:hypothetical protein|nr:hypothetical protein [Gemmatimonadales bacterium]
MPRKKRRSMGAKTRAHRGPNPFGATSKERKGGFFGGHEVPLPKLPSRKKKKVVKGGKPKSGGGNVSFQPSRKTSARPFRQDRWMGMKNR